MFHVVIHRSGPEYDLARPLEEQSGWEEHAAFMDALVDDGFIVLGGPLADEFRVVHAVEAESEEEVAQQARRRSLERVAPGRRRRRALDDQARRSHSLKGRGGPWCHDRLSLGPRRRLRRPASA